MSEKKDARKTDVNADEERKYTFAELSKGENEVLIQHEDQVYRLRVTRGGGLILNK